MKIEKAHSDKGLAFKITHNKNGFAFGLLKWPWVNIIDFNCNFWHRLCCACWFWGIKENHFQIRYLWFTFMFIFRAK